MAENSKINWTTHTFNPWIGCTKVSPGCLHCYAETLMDTRYGRVKWGKGNPRSRTAPTNWKKVRSWNNAVSRAISEDRDRCPMELGDPANYAERPRVFCASLADWLDAEVDITWLADLLELVGTTPNLDWLMLTKRPELWRERLDAALEWCRRGPYTKYSVLAPWINEWLHGTPPANIWVGTTVEDQTRADLRIPQLLAIPAKVRFLSCEPLIGSVTFDEYWLNNRLDPSKGKIDWVICGGESGSGAREMHEVWAADLRAECRDAHVAFWMKQMGGTPNPRHELHEMPETLRVRELPAGYAPGQT